MALKTTVEDRKKGVYVVALEGRLDSNTSPALDQKVAPLLKAGTKAILFDMAKLEFISSMGLRIILNARKVLQQHKGHVGLVHLQPPIAKVFELADILPQTSIFASRESADIFLEAVQNKEIVKGMDVDD
jgi:anti-anti-sigma factor